MFKQNLANAKNVRAIVFISSKPDNFIAGADIDMLQNLKDKSELKELTRKAHASFTDLKKLNVPLIAAINGAALGGGVSNINLYIRLL